jgi:hypothetical protein
MSPSSPYYQWAKLVDFQIETTIVLETSVDNEK